MTSLLALRRLSRLHTMLVLTGVAALAGASTIVYAAVVVPHGKARLRLVGQPASRVVAPGHSARFVVRVRRTRFSGSVRLRVLGTVPGGVTATLGSSRGRHCASARSRYRHRVCWYPTTSRQTRVDLTVRTTSRTRQGVFRLRIQGLRRGGGATHTLSVFVTVRTPSSGTVSGQGTPTPTPAPAPAPAPGGGTTAPGGAATVPAPGGDDGGGTSGQGDEDQPFPISGDVSGLAPGVTRPIDLQMSNDRDDARLVTSLTVAQGAVTAPGADLQHPCSTADFSVAQMPAGAFPIVLPPGTHRLSELGVPVFQWPSLTMLARPLDQDGCQGGSQGLVFTGQTTEAPR